MEPHTGTQQVRQEVLEAIKLTQERQYDEATQVLRDGIASDVETSDEKAVLLSTLGMILKKQGKLDEAWDAYQEAEQTIPDDPFIKMIIARFLLNVRREYDPAIRKLKQVLKLAKEVPSIRHQTYVLLGLAFLRKNQAGKAAEMLTKSMEGDFEGMVTTDNIDFNLVEALIREQLEIEKCQHFLQAAYNLARVKKEYTNMTQYRKILDSFETTNV